MKKTTLVLVALAVLGGCDLMDSLIPDEPEWVISATVASHQSMSGVYVFVTESGQPVNNAAVEINGRRIPYTYQQYGATIPTIRGGDPVNLVVTGIGASINETLMMPPPATNVSASEDAGMVTVSWSLLEDTDAVLVLLDGDDTESGTDIEETLAGNATGMTFATSLLAPGGGTVDIAVVTTRSRALEAGGEFSVGNMDFASCTYE